MLSVQKTINVFLIVTFLYVAFMIAMVYLNSNLQYELKAGVLSEDKKPIGQMLKGMVYKQKFYSDIDIIDGILIQIATYNHQVDDIINFKITNGNYELASINFPTKNLTDWQIVKIPLEKPLQVDKETELVLEISSTYGENGNAVAFLSSKLQGQFPMMINDNVTSKQLDFSLYGKNVLFLGKHYIIISIIGYIILVCIFCMIVISLKYNKNSKIISVIENFLKYNYLLSQLIIRDFKVKYKRSILGIFWSFLNPLLMMSVQYIVFSNIFKFDIPNYALYLLIGIVMFSFFVDATTNGMGSIVTNSSLITKVYVPKYIFPVSKVFSTSINLILSIIPLFVVMFITNISLTSVIIFLPYFIIMLIFFTIGISLILATFMVFFRDMQFLWGVFANIWMYATPIIYPITILPDFVQKLMIYNPLYHYINAVRIIIIDGQIPNINIFAYSFIYTLVILIIGSVIFKRAQNRFALYI